MRPPILLILLAFAHAAIAQPAGGCGEVFTVPAHSATTTRYTFVPGTSAQGPPVALVMLIGGGGYMDLDDQGCARQLSRNVLIRMRPLFQAAGVATALADAPSDLKTDEGLGGFRIAADHADDLGKVIADVRKRTGATVWIAGHSRGSISAANAAARLTGPSAPDGVILMSAMMAGDARARKAWAAQSVFYVDLDAIKSPVLVIGHAADNCVRSPADLMDKVAATTHSARRQTVTVTGGPVSPGRPPNLAACEVREPHDFIEQEAEVAAGIARFMRGGAY